MALYVGPRFREATGNRSMMMEMLRCAVVLACGLALSSGARAESVFSNVQPAAVSAGSPVTARFEAVPLDNAEALKPFYALLKRAGEKQAQVRIAYYGDSHTAPDLITGRLRHGLQSAFGEAGIGFVPAAKPWPYHRHSLVEYVESKGFTGVRISRSVRGGKLGLFGAALKVTGKRPAIARLRTHGYAGETGNSTDLTLYYLKQPRGGRVSIAVDGKRITQLSTAGKPDEAGYLAFSAPLGTHEIELRTQGDGPVTLFGLTLDQKGPGVILDTLGIPGARAKFHLLWDEPLYREHLLRRNPDLVVLSYGTNEAGDKDLSPADYEQTLRRTVLRIKSYLPSVSCLLVGPTDRPELAEDGTLHTRDQLYGIVAVQRRLAHELGCAFFDVAQSMGGPMSIVRLAQQSPPLATRDHVHLTMKGYEALGDALLESLMMGYRALDPRR